MIMEREIACIIDTCVRIRMFLKVKYRTVRIISIKKIMYVLTNTRWIIFELLRWDKYQQLCIFDCKVWKLTFAMMDMCIAEHHSLQMFITHWIINVFVLKFAIMVLIYFIIFLKSASDLDIKKK